MDFESFKPKSFFELFNEQLLKYIYSEKALHKRIGLGIASENMKPKDMYCFHVIIQLKSFTIVFCHQIRGDLIYVFDKINIESHNTIIDYSYENEFNISDNPKELLRFCRENGIGHLAAKQKNVSRNER